MGTTVALGADRLITMLTSLVEDAPRDHRQPLAPPHVVGPTSCRSAATGASLTFQFDETVAAPLGGCIGVLGSTADRATVIGLGEQGAIHRQAPE